MLTPEQQEEIVTVLQSLRDLARKPPNMTTLLRQVAQARGELPRVPPGSNMTTILRVAACGRKR